MVREKKVPIGIISLFLLFLGGTALLIVSRVVPEPNPVNKEESRLVSAAPPQKKAVNTRPVDNKEIQKGEKLFENVTYDQQLAIASLNKSAKWQESLAEFIAFVSADIENNGFNSLVANLSDEEWSTLFNYLKRTKSNGFKPKKK